MPLRYPGRMLGGAEFDRLLAEGDRRSGRLIYRTNCTGCRECRAIRVPVAEFASTASQRRSARRNEDVTVRVGTPDCTETHLDLYNRHKLGRGLSRTGEPLAEESYRRWLVDTCVQTVEIQYLVGDRLIAVSILDVGLEAVSSVYHYFDPEESKRSMGVFSVLWELAWCNINQIKWYYLGYYVRDCAHLNYKANYYPHEVQTDEGWARVGG